MSYTLLKTIADEKLLTMDDQLFDADPTELGASNDQAMRELRCASRVLSWRSEDVCMMRLKQF